jgi:hypothetical protein
MIITRGIFLRPTIFDANYEVSTEHLVVSRESVEDIINKLTDRVPVMGNVVSFVGEKFGIISKYLSSKYNEFYEHLQMADYKGFVFANDIAHNVGYVRNTIQDMRYIDYKDLIVVVPESFTGNLRDFTLYLLPALSFIEKETLVFLNEYKAMLGAFINNKDDQISTKDLTKLTKEIDRVKVDLQKKYSKFFPTNSMQTRVRLGKVFGNFAELESFFQNVYSIDVSMKRINLKGIVATVKDIVQYFDIILQNVKDSEINTISPESARNIGKGAYEVAQFVEFVSVIYFKAINTIASAEDIMNIIVRLKKGLDVPKAA